METCIDCGSQEELDEYGRCAVCRADLEEFYTCDLWGCTNPAVTVINGWTVCEEHVAEAERAENKYTS